MKQHDTYNALNSLKCTDANDNLEAASKLDGSVSN